MKEELSQITSRFNPISLAEMDSVALMKRTDTKFVIPRTQLSQFLNGLNQYYRVLSIDDHRIMTYISEYYDTKNYQFYKDHHNAKINRTKIRIRNYVESGLYFLEVKRKNGRGETNKKRVALSSFEKILSPSSLDFITRITKKNRELSPSLTNEFQRITLVRTEDKERVTIDVSLSFKKDEVSKKLNDIVVIEVKQERFNRNSYAVQKLHSLGQRRFSMSKYCIGLASLITDLKQNAFKRKFQTINKLIPA